MKLGDTADQIFFYTNKARAKTNTLKLSINSPKEHEIYTTFEDVTQILQGRRLNNTQFLCKIHPFINSTPLLPQLHHNLKNDNVISK